MFHRVFVALVVLALVVLTGCPSLSTMQTPATVPKGEVRFGIGLEGVGYSEKDSAGGTSTVVAPQVELNARYGVTDDIDLGAKLYLIGAEIGGKYQFAKGTFEAAVAPAVSYISVSVALQRAFARREVDKRYAAWLDGVVAGDHGTVELALRVDLDDRPRQIYDPAHGKPAITAWRVVERTAIRTRVTLVPRTGRTHQLRVHAAHPLGLGAPIVGDRLYGTAGAGVADRLALHAESLAFTHPHTQRRIELVRPAPF